MNKKELEEKQKALNKTILAIEELRYDEDTAYLDSVLEEFKKTQTRIDEHLASFIARYSEDGMIELLTIYYLLTLSEKRKLKYSLEEIIDRGMDDEAVDELQRDLKSVDLSRIKGLQLQIKAELKSLNHKLKETLGDHYEKNYLGTFNDTHYAFFEYLGLSKNPSFFEVTKALIKETIKEAYRGTGQNYEDILNYYTDDVIEKINREILSALRGMEKYSDIVERIGKQTGMNYNRAKRLIRTDSAYIGTRAQRDLYEELGVESVLFVATLDERTSEMCREMDGSLIPISEIEPGFNAPPLHEWCRSVLAPAIEEGIITRAARDPETGKTVFIEKYMSYKEWANLFKLK